MTSRRKNGRQWPQLSWAGLAIPTDSPEMVYVDQTWSGLGTLGFAMCIDDMGIATIFVCSSGYSMLLLVSKTLQHNTCWSLCQRTNSFAYINWFNILQISSTICSSLISMFCCKTLGLRLSILDGDIMSCTPFKHLTSLSDQQKLPSHNFTGAKTAMVLRVHQTASISYIWIYLDLRQAKYITV